MQNQTVNLIWQLLKSALQHIRDLFEVRMAAQIVTDNFAIEQIKNWRQVELLVVHLELRNICDPFSIRLVCLEMPFQQIWCNLSDFTFVGIALSFCANLTDQSQLFHEFLNSLVIHTNIVVV